MNTKRKYVIVLCFTIRNVNKVYDDVNSFLSHNNEMRLSIRYVTPIPSSYRE